MTQNKNSNHINSTIHCSVANCQNHSDKGYCTLNQIHVGCCDNNKATNCKSTECDSFQLCTNGNNGCC